MAGKKKADRRARTRVRRQAPEAPRTAASAKEPRFLAHFHPERSATGKKVRELLAAAGLESVVRTASGAFVVRATRVAIDGLVATEIKEIGVPRLVNRAAGIATRRGFADLPSAAPPPCDSSGAGRFVLPVPFDHRQPSAYPPRVPYCHLHPSRRSIRRSSPAAGAGTRTTCATSSPTTRAPAPRTRSRGAR